jgi:hypothetical protein
MIDAPERKLMRRMMRTTLGSISMVTESGHGWRGLAGAEDSIRQCNKIALPDLRAAARVARGSLGREFDMARQAVRTALKHVLWFCAYGALGVVLTLLVVFVLYLEGRPDLDAWHRAELDEEFTAASRVTSFEEYLALEDRLFAQLDERVYDRTGPVGGDRVNRYKRGSLSDPQRWTPDWNRSFEMPVAVPRASVLLLHGLSDSPYSLRALGERLHAAGAHVVGLRIPGHGTAPSGLVTVRWQDMAAAVRLAVVHLAERNPGRPIHVVGYSNGAALAVQYALAAIDDPAVPRVDRLVLLALAIGVAAAAALAVWQARLGYLLGLDKLA